MKMQELMAKFKRAREIQLTPFKNNIVLMDKIPELATAIFKEEFGINIKIKEAFPLVFSVGKKLSDSVMLSQQMNLRLKFVVFVLNIVRRIQSLINLGTSYHNLSTRTPQYSLINHMMKLLEHVQTKLLQKNTKLGELTT